MAGLNSKNILLGYKTSSSATSYTNLENLQSIADLGGDVEKIETTVLSSGARTYINGLESYGDGLEFKFLYLPDQFDALSDLTGEVYQQVTIPDSSAKTGQSPANSTCTFTGECAVKFNGVGVGEALTYTLTITPSSEMVWTI